MPGLRVYGLLRFVRATVARRVGARQGPTSLTRIKSDLDAPLEGGAKATWIYYGLKEGVFPKTAPPLIPARRHPAGAAGLRIIH